MREIREELARGYLQGLDYAETAADDAVDPRLPAPGSSEDVSHVMSLLAKLEQVETKLARGSQGTAWGSQGTADPGRNADTEEVSLDPSFDAHYDEEYSTDDHEEYSTDAEHDVQEGLEEIRPHETQDEYSTDSDQREDGAEQRERGPDRGFSLEGTQKRIWMFDFVVGHQRSCCDEAFEAGPCCRGAELGNDAELDRDAELGHAVQMMSWIL